MSYACMCTSIGWLWWITSTCIWKNCNFATQPLSVIHTLLISNSGQLVLCASHYTWNVCHCSCCVHIKKVFFYISTCTVISLTITYKCSTSLFQVYIFNKFCLAYLGMIWIFIMLSTVFNKLQLAYLTSWTTWRKF